MKKTLHKLVLLFLLIVGAVNTITATNEKYAVIINGVKNSSDNYLRYWNDCSAVYQTLRHFGYESDKIYVAMSDGQSYGNDIQDLNGQNSSSDHNLDGEGYDEIQYVANREEIEYIFEMLTSTMTDEDDLFIFMTGHGGSYGVEQSYISLWGGTDSLTDVEFLQLLEPIPARTINIVMGQSYSGGFIDDLKNLHNIVITTACDSDEPSMGRNDRKFSAFVYLWVSQVYGYSPTSFYPYRTPEFIITPMDENEDGYISMAEAYDYVWSNDHSGEHPQIFSNPYCLAQSLALNELLNTCDLDLVSGWDLYMQDNPEDRGLEPNQTTDKCWITDDMWFEQYGHRVEVLQSGVTYDMCVRVRNRGEDPSPSNDAVLYTHWTKACIGGGWSGGWTGDVYHCNGTPVRVGDMIDSVVLPPISGGDNYVARIPWTTPLSEEYTPCLEFAGESLNELWHYCVLARIVDSQEQPDETFANMNFKNFVLDFNNVVSRNVTIMDVMSTGNSSYATGVVGLIHPELGNNSGPYTLKCEINGEEYWDHYASVSLKFDPLFRTSQPYMSTLNCYAYTTDSFEIYDNAQFENIYFSYDDDGFYPIIVKVNFYYPYEFGNSPIQSISLQLLDTQGDYIGGEEFIFRNNPNLANLIQYRRTDDAESTKDNFLNESEEILFIDVYNMQGQHLTRCKNINTATLDLPAGTYILRVQTENNSHSIKFIK